MADRPNIVLVHGAWADGSSWSGVITRLQDAGYRPIAVQIPLTSLADDVAVTRRAIDAVEGPTVLAGHSYGGAVISGAASGAPKVTGLVYVAAFAPDQGESGQDINSRFPAPPSLQYLRPDAAGFVYIDRDHFPEVFAQDVAPEQAGVMAAVQKPLAAAIFDEKAGPAAWRQIRTWYQVSEDDRVINPDAERWMAERMGAKTISLRASHAAMVSHPGEIAGLIMEAAEAGAR